MLGSSGAGPNQGAVRWAYVRAAVVSALVLGLVIRLVVLQSKSSRGSEVQLSTATTDGMLNVITVLVFVCIAGAAVWRCAASLASRGPSVVAWSMDGGSDPAGAGVAVLAVMSAAPLHLEGYARRRHNAVAPASVVVIRGAPHDSRFAKPEVAGGGSASSGILSARRAFRATRSTRIGPDSRGQHERGAVQCAVCRRDMRLGEGAIALRACGHLFHRQCAQSWLTAVTSKCPVCQRDAGTYSAHDTDNSTACMSTAASGSEAEEAWRVRSRQGAVGVGQAPSTDLVAGPSTAPRRYERLARVTPVPSATKGSDSDSDAAKPRPRRWSTLPRPGESEALILSPVRTADGPDSGSDGSNRGSGSGSITDDPRASK